MLRWGPRWLMIFSSDMRACFSLLRAVAVGQSRGELWGWGGAGRHRSAPQHWDGGTGWQGGTHT